MYIQASIQNIHVTEEPHALAEHSKSKFKDTFTKAVEVFFRQSLSVNPTAGDSFILSTGIGNSENIVQLINQYRTNKFVSAQLFPEATMSSASVNINRLFGLKGGNISVNPNLSFNDTILLGLLDAAGHCRTTHLIYGEVNDFEMSQKAPNHLIYVTIAFSTHGSYIDLSGNKHDKVPLEYDDLSIQLKSMMSPKLYQYIDTVNASGEISSVYHTRQLAYA